MPIGFSSGGGGLTAAQKTKLDGIEAGADVSPVLTESIGTTHASGATTTWDDWDLSGLVGAASVLVFVAIQATVGDAYGVRTNGSALVRSFALAAGGDIVMPVLTDASGIIEVYGGSNATYEVVGWMA